LGYDAGSYGANRVSVVASEVIEDGKGLSFGREVGTSQYQNRNRNQGTHHDAQL